MISLKTLLGYLTVAVLFIAYSVGGAMYVHRNAEYNTANALFRYCHDHGGILTNSETGEKIGCMAVVQQQQHGLDKKEEPWYNNS